MSDRFDGRRANDGREPRPRRANPVPPGSNPDLWRNILAFVSDAVFVHRPDGPFLEVNDAACRLLGYSADELRKMGPRDIDVPEFAALVPDRIAGLLRDGQAIFETEQVARGGRHIPVEIHAQILMQDGQPYIVTVARDITAHRELVERLREANDNLERIVAERTLDLNQRNEELLRENAQRRQIEERLRASEEKYRLMVETAREGVWIIDAQNRTTFANPRMAEMLGCSAEEMAGAGLFEYMDEEGRRIAERNIERRRQGIHEQHDFKFIRKDGTPVWTLIETSPIHEPDGAYAGAIALVTDITERRRQEVEMEQLALEWQETFDKVADPIFLMTPDFLITRCNEALCTLTGLGRDQIVGRSCCMIVHGLACPVAGCPALLAARSCCRCMSELEFKGRCFEVIVDPIVGGDGCVISSIHIMRDITRRKESEASLRTSEARWRSLVTHAPILITLFDAAGVVRFCNQPQRLLGREQVLGEPVEAFLPSEAGQRLAEALRDVFAGRLPQRYEMESREPGGDGVWFENRVAPVLEDGRVAGAIWVAVNITGLKQAEARLRDLNRSLEGRVAARTRELENAQAELVMRAKMASIGQMAAGIAHEINNPVSFVATNIAALQQHLDALRQMLEAYRGVIGRLPLEGGLAAMVQALREKEAELAVDYTIRDLDRLVWESAEGLRRVTRILTGVRNFSHLSRSEAPAAYDLNAAVRDTLILARSAYLDTVDVQTSLGTLPEVLCIPAQVNQVILNLFMNAVQALNEPGRGAKGRIDIRTWHDPGWVLCEIRDNGPGLPVEHREKVFRESFSTKSYQQGTGLGLTICHDIVVNRHGGRISFTCPPGGGTAFLVELPDGTAAPVSGAREDPP